MHLMKRKRGELSRTYKWLKLKTKDMQIELADYAIQLKRFRNNSECEK